MPRPRKERGRPLTRLYPPRSDATAEDIASAMFALPTDHVWDYEKKGGTEYHCVACERPVHYPKTLYRDGRCEDCRKSRARETQ